MEKDIFYEIMDDVLLNERSASKEKYVGEAKEIRIHPRYFNELRNSKRYAESGNGANPFANTIEGIPLTITPDVEKWKIVI